MDKAFFKGKGLTFIPKGIDNLFRFSPKHKQESLDYIFLKSFLKENKFAPILLKEAFSILKPKGYLIIEYHPSKSINSQTMEELFWWLFKGNYHIILHEQKDKLPSEDCKLIDYKNRLIIQKKASVFNANDSINKWSFGIVTNGTRDDWLELIINSIKRLKIPHYEIIICGKYKKRPEKNIIYINFNERSDRGWITKKKNLIAEKAKYENLCIIHDRLVFDKKWYQGMKKYGNAFELLGCIQEEENGTRTGDWLTFGGSINQYYRISSLNYTDWDYNTYLSGQLVIIKKSLYLKILWDETRYWVVKTEKDKTTDADFSFRGRELGHIIRLNTYSKCTALTWQHGYIPIRYDPSEKVIPDMVSRRAMRLFARTFYKVPVVNQLMLWGLNIFVKTGIYQKITSK